MPGFLGGFPGSINFDLCAVPYSLDSAPESSFLLVQVKSIVSQSETCLDLESERKLYPCDFKERFVHEVHLLVGAFWSS